MGGNILRTYLLTNLYNHVKLRPITNIKTATIIGNRTICFLIWNPMNPIIRISIVWIMQSNFHGIVIHFCYGYIVSCIVTIVIRKRSRFCMKNRCPIITKAVKCINTEKELIQCVSLIISIRLNHIRKTDCRSWNRAVRPPRVGKRY